MPVSLVTITLNRSSAKSTYAGYPNTLTANVYDSNGKNLASKEARIDDYDKGIPLGYGTSDLNGQFTIGNIVFPSTGTRRFVAYARENASSPWVASSVVAITILSAPSTTTTTNTSTSNTPGTTSTSAPATQPATAYPLNYPMSAIISNVGFNIPAGTGATLSAQVSGGTAPFKYDWEIRDPFNVVYQKGTGQSLVVPNFGGIGSGLYDIFLTVTDAKGLTNTKQAKMTVTTTKPATATSVATGQQPGTPSEPTQTYIISKAGKTEEKVMTATSAAQLEKDGWTVTPKTNPLQTTTTTAIANTVKEQAIKVEDFVQHHLLPVLILTLSLVTIAVLFATKAGKKALAKVGAPIGK